MKKIFIVFLISIVLTQIKAQDKTISVYTAATDNKAVLLMGAVSGDMEGFRVYRKETGGSDFELLTPQPVVPMAGTGDIRQLLGEDYEWAARVLRADDSFEILQKLRAEPGLATVISFANLKIAEISGRLFIDKDVRKGKRYVYKIEWLDYAGQIINTFEETIQIEENRPKSPVSVTTQTGDESVKLSWDYPAYSGESKNVVIGYHIYRKKGNDAFKRFTQRPILRQENMKTRTDVSVKNGLTYTYYLTAVNLAGTESMPSEHVVSTPADQTAPQFPQGLSTIPEEGNIVITWDMNLELDLSHYDIYKSLDMHEGYEPFNSVQIPGDQPHYTDSLVYSGPTYHYKVKAVDQSGNLSEFSNEISGQPGDTTAPDLPDSLNAEVVGHNVKLTWSKVADPDLTGFYVYQRRMDESFLRITPNILPGDTLYYYDSGFERRGLWAGKGYEYGLSCVDAANNESEMKRIALIIPDDEPPMPPLSSYARSTEDGLVEITWQPSMSLDVIHYRVFRGEENTPLDSLIDVNDSTFSYIDSTSIRGETYQYCIAAVDAAGNESEKTEVTIVTPRDLVAPWMVENIRARATSEGVQIIWDPVLIDDILGYHVYRSDVPNLIGKRINREPVTTITFIDREGKAGAYYRVSSMDTSGRENLGSEAVEAVGDGGEESVEW